MTYGSTRPHPVALRRQKRPPSGPPGGATTGAAPGDTVGAVLVAIGILPGGRHLKVTAEWECAPLGAHSWRIGISVSPLQHGQQARVKVVAVDTDASACPAQKPCSCVAPVPGWASAGDRSPLGDGGLDDGQTACHVRLLPPLPQES